MINCTIDPRRGFAMRGKGTRAMVSRTRSQKLWVGLVLLSLACGEEAVAPGASSGGTGSGGALAGASAAGTNAGSSPGGTGGGAPVAGSAGSDGSMGGSASNSGGTSGGTLGGSGSGTGGTSGGTVGGSGSGTGGASGGSTGGTAAGAGGSGGALGGKALLASDEKQGKETAPLYKKRLEMLGFTVTELGGDCSGPPSAGFDVIVVSESCESARVASSGVFETIATPVVSAEGHWLDESGVAKEGLKVGAQTTIEIIDSTHPIAAGLTGKVVVYPQPHTLFLGSQPAPGATKVATQDGNPQNFALLAVDKGAQLTGGKTAPARRVHWFWEIEAGASLTGDGWKIFDASVNWAAGRL